MMGVYALAEAMGVKYVHSPLTCIGHIGGQPHWRNQSCQGIDPTEAAKMQRISGFLSMTNTTTADTSSWAQELFTKGSWLMLANVTETALRLQRPTVVRIEWVHNFLSDCPDLFLHVPAWRPSNPQLQPVSSTPAAQHACSSCTGAKLEAYRAAAAAVAAASAVAAMTAAAAASQARHTGMPD
jgi:hypothetical protein